MDELDLLAQMQQDYEGFPRMFNLVAIKCHLISKQKGFYDPAPSTAERIALMHSELSEALEADRQGDPQSEKLPGRSLLAEELADCVIRIMDFAGYQGIDLGSVIQEKIAYNEARPHKHGKKY